MKESKQSQIDKFREAARDLETDDSEEAFDAKLKKVVESVSRNGKMVDRKGNKNG